MDFLWGAFAEMGEDWWRFVLMWVIGIVLIVLAIVKKLEPALLLPIGIGCIIVNIPGSGVVDQYVLNEATGQYEMAAEGIIDWLYKVGIKASEAMPILLFIGIGAMIDFGPLIANPKLFIFGGAAQFGIFVTILIAAMIPMFDFNDAASIGIIGAADGPTSIMVAQRLGSKFVAPITVVAYSYMALVPIIQPVVIKGLTTKKERRIRMEYDQKSVSRRTRIMFPIVVTIVAGLIAPQSLALVGFLMFGNLIRECGVLETLNQTAQNVLTNLITLLLGITIASQMRAVDVVVNGVTIASSFLSLETIIIMGLGLLAFIIDTASGVLFAKGYNLIFRKNKINPMIGAAGISAFPMSARVVQRMSLKEDPTNHILMQAIGVNVSGQIASAVVGGLVIGLVLG